MDFENALQTVTGPAGRLLSRRPRPGLSMTSPEGLSPGGEAESHRLSALEQPPFTS
ncbi:protein of unknown function [Modestobacter italicus]|uniref:Uncharacterized protein n=1 Tax=Modestobacter italicus (strain DSM 44449 / CECT 9708 / BC 501) TaxID=2732864 RepID=I4F0I7_MODI5|nr:protein of unknown function [Modestobacter marinus]